MSNSKEVIDLYPQRRNNHYGNTRPEALDRIILPFASLVIAGTFGSAILKNIEQQPAQEIANKRIAQNSNCRFTNDQSITYYTHPSENPEAAIGLVGPGEHSCLDLREPTRPGTTRWLSFVDSKTGKLLGYVAEDKIKEHNIG